MDQKQGSSGGAKPPVIVHHSELAEINDQHIGRELFILYSEQEWDAKVTAAKKVSAGEFAQISKKFQVAHDVHRLGNGWVMTVPKCPRDQCTVTVQRGKGEKGHFMFYQPRCQTRIGLSGKGGGVDPVFGEMCTLTCGQGNCTVPCSTFSTDAEFGCRCDTSGGNGG